MSPRCHLYDRGEFEGLVRTRVSDVFVAPRRKLDGHNLTQLLKKAPRASKRKHAGDRRVATPKISLLKKRRCPWRSYPPIEWAADRTRQSDSQRGDHAIDR